jgi:hypothetical protein
VQEYSPADSHPFEPHVQSVPLLPEQAKHSAGCVV